MRISGLIKGKAIASPHHFDQAAFDAMLHERDRLTPKRGSLPLPINGVNTLAEQPEWAQVIYATAIEHLGLQKDYSYGEIY